MRQSKRCILGCKMQFFFVRMIRGVCANCQPVHLTRIFCLLRETPWNYRIIKMDGKECVFINNTTEMRISPQWGHWVDSVYQSTKRRSIKRHICRRIGLEENKNILLWITWAHRWNFQPPHWIVRIWKGSRLAEWKITPWEVEELMHCR